MSGRRALFSLRGEEGITLIELVIVCSIMTVVLGYVTRTMVVMQNASVQSSLRLQNLDEARTLMDVVSRDVRTATRMTATTSPYDVSACTATSQVQPCAPAGWGSSGNAAPYAGKQEMWFYSNLTLGNQSQASPCPDIVHLFVDSSVSPPVLKEQTIADNSPTTDTPPNCVYGTGNPYTGTYTTRLVGKYIVNGSSNCLTTAPVFVYWYDDGTGTPASYADPTTTLASSDLLGVNAIGITFAIRQSTNFSVPCAVLQNRVSLENVNYNPIPSPSP
jgi:type II secretory pathway pseudopilin PulG